MTSNHVLMRVENLVKHFPIRQGIIFHNQVENRIWVDSFYMCPPFLAAAGQPEEAEYLGAYAPATRKGARERLAGWWRRLRRR